MRRFLWVCLLSVSAFGCAANTSEVGPKDFISGKISKINPNGIITVDTTEGDYVIEIAYHKPFGSYGSHTTQNVMSVLKDGDQISFPKSWTYLDWPTHPFFISSPPTANQALFSSSRIGVVDPNDIKFLDRK